MTRLTEWKARFGTLESVLALIEMFPWNITIVEHEGKWLVRTGETLILEADTRNEVDILLYGMALAYDAIPDAFYESLVENIQKWKDEL